MDLNPLDWDNPSFLMLYAVLAAAGLLLVRTLRKRLGAPAAQPPPALDPLQAAYLAGGPARTADTALVGLTTFGAATYDPSYNHFHPRPGATLPAWLRPYATTITRQMPRQAFHAAAAAPLARLRTTLEANGLVATQDQVTAFRRIAFLVMAIPIGLGLLKLLAGLSVGDPVLFLVVALAVTTVLASIIASARHPVTPAGAAALTQARTASARPPALHHKELAAAFAIGGAAVLAGTSLAPFGRTLGTSSDDSSDSSGSDDSDAGSSDTSGSSDSSGSDSGSSE